MNKKAFSLIELVMVIMFLGILTVVAVMAVDTVFQKSKKEASLAAKKMLIPIINDYLLETKILPASCTVTECPLVVLIDEGYLKEKPCDKTSNKVIDTASTKFLITEDDEGEYICGNTCSEPENWELFLTNTECSDVNITPNP